MKSMSTRLILVLIAVSFSAVACVTLATGQTATGPSKFQAGSQQQKENNQNKDSPQSKPPNRMEDHGCCVLKKSKYKPEWDYSDDEVRKLCVETARKSGFDYDFYKDQKCEDVKKLN